ncbi:MAG: hypothetical protein ACRBN8_30075 [Nannocystales bacterium]
MLGSVIAMVSVLADPVDFHWNAPDQCPSEPNVRARVQRYLGDADPPQSVRAQADVTARPGGGWQLVLTTIDTHGDSQTREFEDADCEGLAETAAVLTALAVDPDVETEAPEVEAEAEPAPAPAPEVEPPVDAADEPEPEPVAVPRSEPLETPPDFVVRSGPTASLRYGLRLSGGVGIGWLPVGGDLGIAATIGRRWWAAELEGLVGLPRSARLDRSPSSGADLLGWSVAGRACGVLPLTSWLALPLCAGLEGGQVRAASVGLDDGSDAALPWIAVLVSPSLRAAVHPRVSVWLMPELQLGVKRPDFHATAERDEVFAPSLASVRVRAGVELVF